MNMLAFEALITRMHAAWLLASARKLTANFPRNVIEDVWAIEVNVFGGARSTLPVGLFREAFGTQWARIRPDTKSRLMDLVTAYVLHSRRIELPMVVLAEPGNDANFLQSARWAGSVAVIDLYNALHRHLDLSSELSYVLVVEKMRHEYFVARNYVTAAAMAARARALGNIDRKLIDEVRFIEMQCAKQRMDYAKIRADFTTPFDERDTTNLLRNAYWHALLGDGAEAARNYRRAADNTTDFQVVADAFASLNAFARSAGNERDLVEEISLIAGVTKRQGPRLTERIRNGIIRDTESDLLSRRLDVLERDPDDQPDEVIRALANYVTLAESSFVDDGWVLESRAVQYTYRRLLKKGRLRDVLPFLGNGLRLSGIDAIRFTVPDSASYQHGLVRIEIFDTLHAALTNGVTCLGNGSREMEPHLLRSLDAILTALYVMCATITPAAIAQFTPNLIALVRLDIPVGDHLIRMRVQDILIAFINLSLPAESSDIFSRYVSVLLEVGRVGDDAGLDRVEYLGWPVGEISPIDTRLLTRLLAQSMNVFGIAPTSIFETVRHFSSLFTLPLTLQMTLLDTLDGMEVEVRGEPAFHAMRERLSWQVRGTSAIGVQELVTRLSFIIPEREAVFWLLALTPARREMTQEQVDSLHESLALAFERLRTLFNTGTSIDCDALSFLRAAFQYLVEDTVTSNDTRMLEQYLELFLSAKPVEADVARLRVWADALPDFMDKVNLTAAERLKRSGTPERIRLLRFCRFWLAQGEVWRESAGTLLDEVRRMVWDSSSEVQQGAISAMVEVIRCRVEMDKGELWDLLNALTLGPSPVKNNHQMQAIAFVIRNIRNIQADQALAPREVDVSGDWETLVLASPFAAVQWQWGFGARIPIDQA